MLFNSIEFAIFLPVIFVLYWFVINKNIRHQNLLILFSSYLFYGWWDWRFLSLIIFSSFIDYFVGIGLAKNKDQGKRKLLLITSILVNLGFLGVFKYFNFFIESFKDAFQFFGVPFGDITLNIVLPVGISFYTFQTLSYSIDVYKNRLQPTKDLIAFFAFVSFFPQLVAGPIERATNLLPQFYHKRNFSFQNASDGMRQILWGLFKKMVVADNCALIVNEIFNNYNEYSTISLFMGGVFFAFQIYGDFSGYSDIAIGTARLFGFNLMQNFSFPYFSRDIAEFWRRWHISLSTWFRDYVYIPLGGSRGGNNQKIRNIFIIFIVSGFWHGANWTFIVWGALNAFYFLPLMLSKKNRTHTDNVASGRLHANIKEVSQILFTFLLTVIAWIFFRAENVSMAFKYLKRMIFNLNWQHNDFTLLSTGIRPFLFIILLVVVEWLQREKKHGLEFYPTQIGPVLRWAIYCGIAIIIASFAGDQQEFIYFQF